MKFTAIFPIKPGEYVYVVLTRPSDMNSPTILRCRVHSCTIHSDGIPRITYYPENSWLKEFAGGIDIPISGAGKDFFYSIEDAAEYYIKWKEAFL